MQGDLQAHHRCIAKIMGHLRQGTDSFLRTRRHCLSLLWSAPFPEARRARDELFRSRRASLQRQSSYGLVQAISQCHLEDWDQHDQFIAECQRALRSELSRALQCVDTAAVAEHLQWPLQAFVAKISPISLQLQCALQSSTGHHLDQAREQVLGCALQERGKDEAQVGFVLAAAIQGQDRLRLACSAVVRGNLTHLTLKTAAIGTQEALRHAFVLAEHHERDFLRLHQRIFLCWPGFHCLCRVRWCLDAPRLQLAAGACLETICERQVALTRYFRGICAKIAQGDRLTLRVLW